jgi:hypothetical protein
MGKSNCEIAEIIVYKTALNDTLRNGITNYLENKWFPNGVAGSYGQSITPQNPSGLGQTGITQRPSGLGQSGITQRPSGLAPRPSGLAPRPSGLAPRPSGLAPRPSGLAPRPSGLAPRPSGVRRPSGLRGGGIRSTRRKFKSPNKYTQKYRK